MAQLNRPMPSDTRNKKRAENYSRKDKERLVECVNKRLDIVENKASNYHMNLQKASCWVEIAKEYNEGSCDCRDDRQLRELWKRMKFTARTDLIRFTREQRKLPSDTEPLDFLDDFTLMLVRLVPAYFQMDTDAKVRQKTKEILGISSSDQVPPQQELQNGQSHIEQQHSNVVEETQNNNNTVVLVGMSEDSCSEDELKVIHESRPSVVTPDEQRTQQPPEDHVIKVSPVDDDSNNREQQQMATDVDTHFYVNPSPVNDAVVTVDTTDQNWYIGSADASEQYEDLKKDYQAHRRRKVPLYRSLLEDENNDEIKRQLLEMACKENEKELLLLDIKIECEKQRLVKEKLESENAELKQRMLLEMLQTHTNKGTNSPSINFHL